METFKYGEQHVVFTPSPALSAFSRFAVEEAQEVRNNRGEASACLGRLSRERSPAAFCRASYRLMRLSEFSRAHPSDLGISSAAHTRFFPRWDGVVDVRGDEQDGCVSPFREVKQQLVGLLEWASLDDYASPFDHSVFCIERFTYSFKQLTAFGWLGLRHV